MFAHSCCFMFQLSRTQITLTEGENSNAELLVHATVPPYLLCPIGARDTAATITITALLEDFTGPQICPKGNKLVQVGSQQEKRELFVFLYWSFWICFDMLLLHAFNLR